MRALAPNNRSAGLRAATIPIAASVSKNHTSADIFPAAGFRVRRGAEDRLTGVHFTAKCSFTSCAWHPNLCVSGRLITQ